MVSIMSGKKAAWLAMAAVAMMFIAMPAMAQEGETSLGEGLGEGLIALGAGIAIAGGAIATARAQAAVGAGGTGALAEKPELFGSILILFAIPETLVIFAFVIAFLLMGNIGA